MGGNKSKTVQSGMEEHDDNHEDRSPLMEKEQASSKPTRQRRQLYKHLLVFLAIIIIATLAIITTSISRPQNPTSYQDCGSSPLSARQRNCHFDILSFAWQTPECYDEVNTEAFRTHNGQNTSWAFYTDLDRASPQLTEAEILTGEVSAFVTVEYHLTHCTYMWRQLHRAYTLKGYIDEHLDNWNHTLHCQRVLLQGPTEGEKLWKVNTIGQVIYPQCRKIW